MLYCATAHAKYEPINQKGRMMEVFNYVENGFFSYSQRSYVLSSTRVGT